MTENFAVQLCDVEFSYQDGHDAQVLKFDCNFAQGAITAIMGSSGSGKSTMLALIAGFEKANSGQILIENTNCTTLPPSERSLSMVFQENNLFAHMNVVQNVGLGIAPNLRLNSDDRVVIAQALDDVGLGQFGDRLPAQLSGGERQRVALARVLVRNKPVLLLDEAFASLGPGLRGEMLDLVAQLSRQRDMSTLMVTHSPDDALRIARDLVFLDQGKVVASGFASDLLKIDTEHQIINSYLGSKSTI